MSPRATKRNGGCYYIALVGDPLPLWEGVGWGAGGVWGGGGLLTPSTSLGGYKTGSSAGFLPNHPDRPALHLPHQTSKVKCCSHQSCDSSSRLLLFSSSSCLLSPQMKRGLGLCCVSLIFCAALSETIGFVIAVSSLYFLAFQINDRISPRKKGDIVHPPHPEEGRMEESN